MLKKLVFGLCIFCCSESFADDKDLKYAEALEKSQKEEKPLVVLISAKWCSSCSTMKSEVLEPMKKDGVFKDAVVTVVDVDENPELVKKLYIVSEETKQPITTLPQVVVFSTKKNNPKKYSWGAGRQSRPRIVELLERAFKNGK